MIARRRSEAERRVARLTGEDTVLDLSDLHLRDGSLQRAISLASSLTSLNRLDISSNRLRNAPAFIGTLTSLAELDLSFNAIATLPDSVGNLVSLTKLDLSYNAIATLPDSVGNLTSLTRLRLKGNTLPLLPDSLGDLTSLTDLDLSFNTLAILPESIANLTFLTDLDLSHNALDLGGNGLPAKWMRSLTALTDLSIDARGLGTRPSWVDVLGELEGLSIYPGEVESPPDWIGGLTTLTRLSLESYGLRTVPDWISNLTALTELSLGGNSLGTLPDWIGSLPALTKLDLSGNRLKTLPDWIGNLSALTELNLSGNRLESLPDWIGNLTSLTDLELSDNPLDALPESIWSLSKLTVLSLHSTGLQPLPLRVGDLTSLTQLFLGHNGLRELPETIGNLTALRGLFLHENELQDLPDSMGNLTDVSELTLSNNALQSLPSWISNLNALSRLGLEDNQLQHVPEQLGNLASLVELDLSGNALTALPVSFGSLASLGQLDLSGNALTALPVSFGSLASLAQLNLDSNKLGVLPEKLGDLTDLTQLNLSRNHLQTVPEWLIRLPALTDLDLGHNGLHDLPEWLGSLTTLKSLTLSENRLEALPLSLGGLPNLLEIALTGNPLPPEVLAAADEGTEELLRFLRLIREEGVLLVEAKLVFVGEGGVGKSSLLATLRGEPWQKGREQTHGMAIKPVIVKRSGQVMTLNGWDFGGQKVYRPTHQLFFTAPAVYLVIWKPREGPELGMIEHWLAMIQHRAGAHAKAHVVATHGGPQQRVAAIDEERLRERFGDLIVGFHEVDSADGTGVQELKAAIAKTADSLPHVRRWYPSSWLRARDAFAAMHEQSLPYGQYEAIAVDQGLSRVGARSLAINSHGLGNWIYYADEPTLAEVVVLKPDWLSTALARVFEDPHAASAFGLVTHRRFGEIWSDWTTDGTRRYSHSQQRVFLRLMERFELAYRVPELTAGEPLSLVAQLVPADRPDLRGVWEDFRPGGKEEVEICQVIEKGSDRIALPEGLIYRLIVRLHRQSVETAVVPEGTHWQGGLLTESRYGARALISLTPDGVRIQVRGPDPATYLRQVADEVRDCVDGFWPGLASRALVPCRTPCGLGTPGRGLVDIDKLITAQDKGRTDFPCPAFGCDEYPAISSLLGGTAMGGSLSESYADMSHEIMAIGERLTDLGKQQVAGTEQILGRIEDLDDGLKAILSRHEAHLNALLRSLDDEAADGPRLFTLTPVDGSVLRPGWTNRRMRLSLFCEHSLWPVHALDPDRPEAGVYTIDVPREWWVKAVPILKITAALLRPFLGVSIAATELDLSDNQWEAVREQLGLAKETLSAAASAADTLSRDDQTDQLTADLVSKPGLVRAEGGVLRTFHAMLRQQDVAYADLRRVRDAQSRYLWVHSRFVHVYQPPLPDIPT